MNERKPEESFDDRLEWDRNGQSYHYLTKWMHALSRVGRVAGAKAYTRWAVELAKTAHARFTYLPARRGLPSFSISLWQSQPGSVISQRNATKRATVETPAPVLERPPCPRKILPN